MGIVRVKKRDGREVPFDSAKIAAAIAKALAAVGEDDTQFAGEVAGVVTLTLEARHAGSPAECVPGIEDIQDLVERALIELGRASVAKAYILYRDRRAKIREALAVHPSLDATHARTTNTRGDTRGGSPIVQEAESTSPWSKGRIVAALMHEADLAREVAEEVAARVEARVFDASFKRISTGLIRELVDNELVALGLSGALRRQTSVGVPLYDLKRILGGSEEPLDASRPVAPEALGERASEQRVASEVLRRYALESVLDEASAERHLSGDFALVGLARPSQPLMAALPAELLLAGEPSSRAAFESLEELVRAARATSAGVVLENPALLFSPLLRERRHYGSLSAWIAATCAAARAAERRLDLGSPGPRAVGATAELVRELAAAAKSPFTPRLFLDVAEIELLLEQAPEREADLERLLLERRVVPTWSAPGERFAAPGCVRMAGERAAIACVAVAALNLPRLAWRAGPWREDRLLAALAELAEGALAALARLAGHPMALSGARSGELRARPMVALAPVGLREALQLLGDGEIRSEQGARILGLLADAAARAAAKLRLSVTLTPCFGERAAARFGVLDARLPEPAQRLLFDEGVGAGFALGRPYTSGFRLSPVSGLSPWSAEAIALRSLATGALDPLPEDRSRGGELGIVPALRAFAALRADAADAQGPLRVRELAPSRPRERAPALFPADLVSSTLPPEIA